MAQYLGLACLLGTALVGCGDGQVVGDLCGSCVCQNAETKLEQVNANLQNFTNRMEAMLQEMVSSFDIKMAASMNMIENMQQTVDQLTKICLGDFRFASYYNDFMVLQKAPSSAAIWGYANNAGDLIKVTFDGAAQTTTAFIGDEGVPIWEASLAPTGPGGPYAITATDLATQCTLTLDDVLFGDVYICSGQSNMAHTMNNIDDPEPDIEDVVNYPDVRTFRAATVYSDEPLYDLESITRTWALPTEANMPSYSAVCWFFGRNLNRQLGYPIGLIQTAWGGTRIEAWSSQDALDECFGEKGPPPSRNRNSEQVLWNAMIHPFLPMSIFGAIWYQGESNRGRHNDYYCSMPAMVNDWRAKWFDRTDGETDPMFPFGQVQLAPNNDNDSPNGFPDLRWAQAGNVGYCPNQVLERVFMAVAADLPDYDSPRGSIHPRYKRQISERLALGVFAVGYDLEATTGRHQGPFPTSITQQGDKVVVVYDDGEADLDLVRTADGFEICCAPDNATICPDAGGTWVRVDVVSQGTSEVHLSVACDPAESITGMRYIWRESECDLEQCPVYSRDNDLPAPPYKYEGLIS